VPGPRVPLVQELDGVGVAQLMGREPAPHTCLEREVAQLDPRRARRPRTPAGRAVYHAEQRPNRVCRGAARITTYAKLAADGQTVTGPAPSRSGNGKLVTLVDRRLPLKAGNKLQMTIEINRTGKALLAKFGRIPATLTLTPTYGYTLTAITKKITFKR